MADLQFNLNSNALTEIGKLADKALAVVAQEVALIAQANITQNNQVDTGFMRASVYAVWQGGDNYNQTWSNGAYFGQKSNKIGQREKGDKLDLVGDYSALVAVGAVYAVNQEVKNHFLYPALEQGRTVVNNMG